MSVIAYWLMGKLGITARLASLITWAGGLLLVALLIGAAVWWFNDTVDDAHDEGVTTERVEAQGKVIENVQKTNETRAAARDPGSCVAYRECLRSARTAANCVRYLPDDEDCPVQSGADDRR